jgi:hypothetical protein
VPDLKVQRGQVYVLDQMENGVVGYLTSDPIYHFNDNGSCRFGS